MTCQVCYYPRTYTSNVSIFWRWCYQRETDPHLADRPAIRAWLNERLECVSSLRVHNDLAALRHFYAWAKDERIREDDPTDSLRVKRSKSLPTEPLDESSLNALLDACKDERDRMLVTVMAFTGLRVSELAAIQAEDIDWQAGKIRLMGKGDKERRVFPNPEVMGRLRAFMGMFPSGPIWLSKKQRRPLSSHQIRKILYDIAERAKLKGVHPHRLRSFFATEYMDEFGDIQALQGLMGHESIETTSRYSEFTRERRGQEQMRRFGSKFLNRHALPEAGS